MTISDLAQEALKPSLLGRTVRYGKLVEHGGSKHIPTGHGDATDLTTDENGKIHLQVRLTVGLGKEARFWAPLTEWTLVNGTILTGGSS